jgi:hypothetical protein
LWYSTEAATPPPQAMLTWMLFRLASFDPALPKEVTLEIWTVMGVRAQLDYDDLLKMKKIRFALIKALHLYRSLPCSSAV